MIQQQLLLLDLKYPDHHLVPDEDVPETVPLKICDEKMAELKEAASKRGVP